MVRVQEAPFDVGAELANLTRGRTDIGGLASFVGLVRDIVSEEGAGAQPITAMTLEHYPGMTEKKLAEIEAEAQRRWSLQASLIVHRYGTLRPSDNIVLVLTASEHREAAFRAAEFLMDYLKTSAPFWKRESGPEGSRWVEGNSADAVAAARWKKHAAE